MTSKQQQHHLMVEAATTIFHLGTYVVADSIHRRGSTKLYGNIDPVALVGCPTGGKNKKGTMTRTEISKAKSTRRDPSSFEFVEAIVQAPRGGTRSRRGRGRGGQTRGTLSYDVPYCIHYGREQYGQWRIAVDISGGPSTHDCGMLVCRATTAAFGVEQC